MVDGNQIECSPIVCVDMFVSIIFMFHKNQKKNEESINNNFRDHCQNVEKKLLRMSKTVSWMADLHIIHYR